MSSFVLPSIQTPKIFNLWWYKQGHAADPHIWEGLTFMPEKCLIFYLVDWTFQHYLTSHLLPHGSVTNRTKVQWPVCLFFYKVIWETFTFFSSPVNLGFCSPVENRVRFTAFSMAGEKVVKTVWSKIWTNPDVFPPLQYIACRLRQHEPSCCFITCYNKSHGTS